MKKYSVSKIGGAGLMMLYEKLIEWVGLVLKNKEPNTQIIIVVSALAKTTRMLQEIFQKKLNGEISDALRVFELIKQIHLQRCKDLFIKDTSKIYEYFYEIEYFVKEGSINKENPTISNAHILKFGELLSSEIFRQFLLNRNLSVKLIDAQKMIYASGDDYCYSVPLQPKTSESISKQIGLHYGSEIILTQGYICYERLLGLDGSDLTAGLIPFGLQLCNSTRNPELTFWKDVDGVIVDGKVLDEISLSDYIQLETTPVRKDAISTNLRYKPKIWVRSFLNLDHPGTLITW